MKKLIMMAAAFSVIAADAALTVTGVTARQRWPWNSLVDIDFTVNGSAGEAYAIDISATATGGEKKLYATSFITEPIAQSGVKTRMVWNLGADYPNFKADDMRVTVTATPFSDSTPVYMVVDLSGGSNAVSYAVRYTTKAPVHTAGVADTCKTTELWLKRVKAGTIQMGGGIEGYPVHTCTLTNDFYLGVFPITWGQYENIGQGVETRWPLWFTNIATRATRPLDQVRFPAIRDAKYLCPDDAAIYADSILKRLRDRTGLDFDLPTEWQWEYACRAGYTGNRYPNAQWRRRSNSYTACGGYSSSAVVDRNWTPEEGGTGYVDEFDANPWGFYSMLGNVWEWCINRSATITAGDTVTEPQGQAADGSSRTRAIKGGSWSWWRDGSATCSSHNGQDSWNVSDADNTMGARVCLTIKKSEVE